MYKFEPLILSITIDKSGTITAHAIEISIILKPKGTAEKTTDSPGRYITSSKTINEAKTDKNKKMLLNIFILNRLLSSLMHSKT